MRRIAAMTLEADDQSGHAQKPWVFFMIGCFMLIVAFLVDVESCGLVTSRGADDPNHIH